MSKDFEIVPLRTEADYQAIVRERDAMLVNLTSTQARCTELLEEARTLRRFGASFDKLTARIGEARRKYPQGPTLRALIEEVGEVASAMTREGPERVKDELLDVTCVAMRLYMGEGEL